MADPAIPMWAGPVGYPHKPPPPPMVISATCVAFGRFIPGVVLRPSELHSEVPRSTPVWPTQPSPDRLRRCAIPMWAGPVGYPHKPPTTPMVVSATCVAFGRFIPGMVWLACLLLCDLCELCGESYFSSHRLTVSVVRILVRDMGKLRSQTGARFDAHMADRAIPMWAAPLCHPQTGCALYYSNASSHVPRVAALEYSVARFSKKLACSTALSMVSSQGSGCASMR